MLHEVLKWQNLLEEVVLEFLEVGNSRFCRACDCNQWVVRDGGRCFGPHAFCFRPNSCTSGFATMMSGK